MELQEADGRPIPGFTLAECDPIFGDEIARVVKWKSASDIRPLASRAIRLRFVMEVADLFSLRFRE